MKATNCKDSILDTIKKLIMRSLIEYENNQQSLDHFSLLI